MYRVLHLYLNANKNGMSNQAKYMVRYTKLVICNDYDTFAAAYLSHASFFETCVSPPPVTHFLRYDTCTPTVQTLRYVQLLK